MTSARQTRYPAVPGSHPIRLYKFELILLLTLSMRRLLSFSVSWCEALGTRIIWGMGT